MTLIFMAAEEAGQTDLARRKWVDFPCLQLPVVTSKGMALQGCRGRRGREAAADREGRVGETVSRVLAAARLWVLVVAVERETAADRLSAHQEGRVEEPDSGELVEA
ncbi:hypothetical protein SAY86_028884 [Trapa natans]|uniref:Uncharacterized protein n=1 Tax=Trapa natans TaxID=22666 RepID=A0AAN7LVN7_TRANT|nr:hypothetical protein SAY86_028884 [Trapa natans]